MSLMLVCGANETANSKLCAILSAIGYDGIPPYEEPPRDTRFISFQSARLSEILACLSNNLGISQGEMLMLIRDWIDALKAYMAKSQNAGYFLSHPKLYLLIPYLQYAFKIKIIYLLDTLLEPDFEVIGADWNQYYARRQEFYPEILNNIEQGRVPSLFVNAGDFIQHPLVVIKKITVFLERKEMLDKNALIALNGHANKIALRHTKRIIGLHQVAVISAYAHETTETLIKCIASVERQTIDCTHILVADGFPNADIEKLSSDKLIHLSLPENIGFNQCGVGVEVAFAMGFEVVAILDADNWYEPHHIETALTQINQSNADVVFAKRKVIFPDGEILSVDDPQDNSGLFADTNCLVLTRKVRAVTPVWLMWPTCFGAGEDRAICICLRQLNFNIAMNKDPTVWYQTNWSHHYKLQKKLPVAPLRNPKAEFMFSFDAQKFYEATGFRLPIRENPNVNKTPVELAVQPRLGVVMVDSSCASVLPKSNPQKYALLVVHDENITLESMDFKRLMLPYHANFKHTAWSIGASLMFQKECDLVLLCDSVDCFNELAVEALLRVWHDNQPGVILSTIKVGGVQHIRYVLVGASAKFFAASWSQLNQIPEEFRFDACVSYLNKKGIKHIHLADALLVQ
jgi:glycosyltransferase involved in cell wall biosynthesis